MNATNTEEHRSKDIVKSLCMRLQTSCQPDIGSKSGAQGHSKSKRLLSSSLKDRKAVQQVVGAELLRRLSSKLQRSPTKKEKGSSLCEKLLCVDTTKGSSPERDEGVSCWNVAALKNSKCARHRHGRKVQFASFNVPHRFKD